MGTALRGERDSDVPCAGCTACCTSSQFVPIEPDETDTLAHIPAELLFPVPGRPPGHVLLGYDEHGRCPMLTDAGCSIYEHRPRTCRTYDCRIFPATGVSLDDQPAKLAVAERVARWRFRFPSADDRTDRAAVLAATDFLRSHSDLVADEVGPAGPTRVAVLAVELHPLFRSGHATPAPETVRAELRRLVGEPPPR
jgi:Fe-S-cluster containining protein